MNKLRAGMQLTDVQSQALRQQLDTRFSALRSYRLSWWAHWAQLAENFLPRRYKWFVTPNQSNRGAQINQNIIDETGLTAARTLAAGMMSGLTSPTRPWFKLGLKGRAIIPFGSIKIWLAELEQILYAVLADSNFYQSRGQYFQDLGIFGSAASICYEDAKDVVRFYNPCAGEYFFAVDDRLCVETLAREFTYTVQQTVNEFTLDAVSPQVAQAYKTAGSALDREIVICHIIEPNTMCYDKGTAIGYPVPKRFPYREVFWEQGSSTAFTLRAAGFNEKPFVGGRWDVTSNDPYGRSPGMDALPAVRQLQIEQRRKAEAIDKMVRPPMVGHVSMRNEPASITPGALTYVADMQTAGFKPAFQVDPRIQEMMNDIKEVQGRIKEIFYSDLFLMISQLEGTHRTAVEIDARREEKLIQLGPVIEREENEDLDATLYRVMAIAQRRGLLPPPPPEMEGETLEINYISMLAEAQKAAKTAGIERMLQIAGSMAAVDPTALDKINVDATMDEYADGLSVAPRCIRSDKEVAQIRAARAKAQQAQAITEATPGMSQAAKNLSQTDTGGGISALEKMLGNA